VDGPDAVITSAEGPVTVTGTGGNGLERASVGVHVSRGGQITAGGTGAVNVSGSGIMVGGKVNYGVLVQSEGSITGASGGNITVRGVAGIAQSGGHGAGVFVIGSGQITATGTLGLSGRSILPGNAGPDFTASGVTFSSDSSLALAIEGATVDTGYTQLNVSGAVDLTGLDLVLVGSFTPAVGSVFTLVKATSITGTFTGLADGATATTFNGFTLRINYTPTAITATAV